MSEFAGHANETPAGVVEKHAAARWLVRGACLLAAVAAMLGVMKWPRAAAMVPALSPFVTAASLLAARTLQAAAVLGLIVGAAAVLRRRWFCRWACPTGLCAEGAGKLGRCLRRRSVPLPRVGRAVALVTLAGACLGYPLLLWLDPLAMFCGLFNILKPKGGALAWWCAAGLPAVLLLSVLLPGAWCARLCPLGAVQELLWSARKMGRSLIARSEVSSNVRIDRRGAFWMAACAAVGIAWAAAAKTLRAAAPRVLRPPGAVDEQTFAGLCVRCGNCMRVCPAKIIAADSGEHGIAGFLAPVVRFQHDYCREDCTRCMDACPSGALRRFAKKDKVRARMGLPRIDLDLCRMSIGMDCYVCQNQCPYEAISMISDDGGYTFQPRVDPRKCPGCGACEVVCPTEPVKAIVVQPRGA